jgi:hypothetical protein
MRRNPFAPFIAPALLALLVACQSTTTYPVGIQPDAETQQVFLKKIIRHVGHMPKKATYETRFDTAFDAFYADQVDKHRIDLLHMDTATGNTYLLVSRIAPSLHVKRVATGIQLRLSGDSLAHYHEVFRTWKMLEPELAEKGNMLFEKMVRGENLTPYYPQHSGKEEYIEFPDENTQYDTTLRRWVTGRMMPK